MKIDNNNQWTNSQNYHYHYKKNVKRNTIYKKMRKIYNHTYSLLYFSIKHSMFMEKSFNKNSGKEKTTTMVLL